jgi:hypothetical protein
MTKLIAIIAFIIIVVWGTGAMMDNVETEMTNNVNARTQMLNSL